MKVGKKLVIGVVVASLSLAAVAGVSFAANGNETSGTATAFANGCRGFFGGAAEAIAKLLGLSQEQLLEKRNAGESLADIAKDQGVAQDKVVDTIIDSKKKFLDERVKAGVITQEQADLMLERMQSRVEERIQDPTVGPRGGRGGCGGGFGRGFGPGARGGFGPGGGYGTPPAAPTSSI